LTWNGACVIDFTGTLGDKEDWVILPWDHSSHCTQQPGMILHRGISNIHETGRGLTRRVLYTLLSSRHSVITFYRHIFPLLQHIKQRDFKLWQPKQNRADINTRVLSMESQRLSVQCYDYTPCHPTLSNIFHNPVRSYFAVSHANMFSMFRFMCHVQNMFIRLTILQTISLFQKQPESWKVIQTIVFLGNDEKCKSAKNKGLVFQKAALKLCNMIFNCYAFNGKSG
jgi:hypothetical protein